MFPPTGQKTTTMDFGANKAATAATGAKGTFFTFGKGGFGAPKVVAVLKPDPLFTRVWKIRSAYDPESVAYQFCYIFYDKQKNDQKPGDGSWANLKPKNIQDEDWINICTKTPDPEHLVPCPVLGFDALKVRFQRQKEIVAKMQQRMKQIQDQLKRMTSFYPTEIQGLFERIQRNSITIEQTMLKVIENREVQQHQNKEMTEGEKALNAKLERMKQDLKRHGMFENAIDALGEKVKRSTVRTGTHLRIDKESLTQLVQVLNSNTEALEALEKSTKNTVRYVESLEEMKSNLI